MNKPFFSIITCTKNSEKYLLSCLSSLASQDYKNYEHIIIDGESTDSTLSLISSNSRIYSVPANGISNAMNEGIKHAKGEYIYFLHSDDSLSDSHVLSNVADFLENNPKFDWVYGQIQVVDKDDNKIGVFPKHKVFQLASPYLLKFFNFIPHQATFVKKSVFEKFGNFKNSLNTSMDYDFWLRIVSYTTWTYLPMVIAEYRIHKEAQSSARSRQQHNQIESQSIQDIYLNPPEKLISRIVNIFIAKVNKTTR